MAELYDIDPVSVFIQESAEDRLTLAEFQWPTGHPGATYTVDANSCVSIELSSYFPARPAAVRWEHRGQIGSDFILKNLFGEEFLNAMQDAHMEAGFTALNLVLDAYERLKIVELQLLSPSSPTKLKRLCAVMASELRQKIDIAA